SDRLAVGGNLVLRIGNRDVASLPALELVRTRTADERVLPRAADQRVVAAKPIQLVVARLAGEHVCLRRAANDVIPRRPDDRRGKRGGRQQQGNPGQNGADRERSLTREFHGSQSPCSELSVACSSNQPLTSAYAVPHA